jgi:LPXTG-motif cell wall-anchored protein
MRTRLRLGAAAAVSLGALLLATVLASPALAWHSNVTVTARCLEGQVRVHYTVEAWEKGHEATVDVSYELNGTTTVLESDDHFFAPQHNQFTGHFDLPADTTGTITFTAVAHWKDAKPSSDTGSAELPKAGKCEESTTTTTVAESTTTTTLQETTTTTETEVAPSSSLATTTTETAAVGAATSTPEGGGALARTGASSGPMLLFGLVLVGGGALVLFISRNRSQTR